MERPAPRIRRIASASSNSPTPCPRSVVMFGERLDHDAQGGSSRGSSRNRAMAPQRRHELFGRLGRKQHGVEERLAIRPAEHHELMFGEDLAGALIGEISGGQSRD